MKRRDFVATTALGLAASPFEMMSQARENKPDARKPRIMVASAHSADFCIRAGGTLIEHVRAGSKVKVVWLSRGETNESDLLYRQQPNISRCAGSGKRKPLPLPRSLARRAACSDSATTRSE